MPQDLDNPNSIAIGTTTVNSVEFTGLSVASGVGKVKAAATSTMNNCTDKSNYTVPGVTLSDRAIAAVIDGLNAGCIYSFELQPVCGSTDGNGDALSANTYTVDQCTKPSRISMANFDETTDTLTLTAVTLNDGFYVDILATQTENCTAGGSSTDLNVTTLPREFTSLETGCLYTIILNPRCTTDGGSNYLVGTPMEFEQCTSEKNCLIHFLPEKEDSSILTVNRVNHKKQNFSISPLHFH